MDNRANIVARELLADTGKPIIIRVDPKSAIEFTSNKGCRNSILVIESEMTLESGLSATKWIKSRNQLSKPSNY